MDFFHSKEKRHGKRAGGLFVHKSASKSNPSSPLHPAQSRSSPATHFGMKRSESECAFPISDAKTTHWKQQQTSERIPNSHQRPPVYRYNTPERPSEPDEDVTPRSNASLSPFRSARTRTPDRRRRSIDSSKEVYEKMYEAEANVSPFHPSRSRSPAPYKTHDRGRERYEAEGNVPSRNSSPSSPFHPHARSQRYNGEHQVQGLYEADADISPPLSPVHRTTSYSPPPPFYSSTDDEDDNNSIYLFPEIATTRRSRGYSGSSTPVCYNYQIAAAETYEQDRQFEPPELPDESQSFTMNEIAKMRGLQRYETASKEEIQSAISETYVSVANYKVRMSVSATLQKIIEKHGDIAASSKLQSTSTRSFYLESLAAAVMELRTTALRDLTKTRVEEIMAVVKDMDSVKIEVSWLKKTVTELAEAVEYFEKYDTAKIVREECDKEMTEGKAEMEELREELQRREKEMKDCRERVTAMAGRLGELEMKEMRVTKHLQLFESKVHKFDGQTVLVDLL